MKLKYSPTRRSHLVARARIEFLIGRRLKKTEEVHHVNEDVFDNRGTNLVACEDSAFHKLLHVRRDALFATGNVHARRCVYCQVWALPDVEGFTVTDPTPSILRGIAYHKECAATYQRGRRDNA